MKNNNPDTDISLMSLLKNGDARAYKTIFDSYYKRLFAFSLQYVKDKYIAEEIVENVFFVLWKKRTKVDKIKKLKPYLYSMVRNASLDHLKKKKKFEPLDIEKHESLDLKKQFIIEEETHAILFQALETLPKKCRKVFELSCIEKVKYKDIAEDLQISINTVKSQRARAIQLLKQCLKNHSFFEIILASLFF